MKAEVLREFGSLPRSEDFVEQVIEDDPVVRGARPPFGTMAVIPRELTQYLSRVPDGVDAGLAAALPAAAMTSLLPLRVKSDQ